MTGQKNRIIYQRLLDRDGLFGDDLVMIGNSIRSDVLPVITIGGRAVHIPYEIIWEHEHVVGDLPEGAVSVAKLIDLLGPESADEQEDRT